MPFPNSQRVIYQRNPLAEVICQLRFAPILRIEGTPPAEFQDEVRDDYPLYQDVRADLQFANLPSDLAGIIQSAGLVRSGAVRHEFKSEDDHWTLTLSRESLALRTTSYERWEDFRRHLDGPIKTLGRVYKPRFFSRLGLRYVDVIQPSILGLESREWADLLAPHIAGELGAPEIRSDIEYAKREIRIKLKTRGVVVVRHGLAVDGGRKEPHYVIDSDFFLEERSEPDDVFKTLDEFNKESRRLFRWCISEVLHDALGPSDLVGSSI